jgi:hypothetical protein
MLFLHENKITDQGIAALVAHDSPFNKLAVINLSWTDVTEQGIAALKERFAGILVLQGGSQEESPDVLDSLAEPK